MGRRKTYDRDDVAERAMAVFWRHGFEGTSIQDLERALSINRYSLFAEFGSKAGLFEAALDVYENHVIAANLGPMEAPGAGVDDILGFLARFRGASDDAALAGCMLCNTAVEQALDDPAVQARPARYFERLRKAMRHALSDVLEGDARDAAAATLSSAALGLFVQARGGLPAATRESVLDGLVRWVRSLAS